MDNILRKLKLKLGFNFFATRLVQATFLSVIDYIDLMYMNEASSVLQRLDSVCHASLCLQLHWYVHIYKALLGKLHHYLYSLYSFTTSS